MPDWSYQTVFRPVLFRMPADTARRIALGAMGLLSRLPFGPQLIDLMGHMRPDPRLAFQRGRINFPSRVGLNAAVVDPELQAPLALSRFGVGFLEVGPFASSQRPASRAVLDGRRETIQFLPDAASGSEDVKALLAMGPSEAARARLRGVRLPILIRWSVTSCDEGASADELEALEGWRSIAAGVIVDAEESALHDDASKESLVRIRNRFPDWPVILACRSDASAASVESAASLCGAGLIDAIRIEPPRETKGSIVIGREDFETSRAATCRMRSAIPAELPLLVAGGVHEPDQALQLRDAGADLVILDAGIVFSGPGLPKRINEAFLHQETQKTVARADPASPVPSMPRIERQSWFWACLMAMAMLTGGVMALAIACTRVVMPYDEAMSGLTRSAIHAINTRLLDIMTHYRVTLAGTMLSLGTLYFGLSFWGTRHGRHWAHIAVYASALAGFFSFFLFLGFGYFDPFHAFVTVVLLQMLLLSIIGEIPEYRPQCRPELTNDRAWRMSQWGQLLYVIHGAVLIVAGGVISTVGITHVFVPEDLEFMNATAEELCGAHPGLLPLVAHDRATFGGMLISTGACVLLSSLWGFRRGDRWFWWTLLVAGTTAYLSTILVHWWVGYTSLLHLLPAYAGLALVWAGSLLSHSHLCGVIQTSEGKVLRGAAKPHGKAI